MTREEKLKKYNEIRENCNFIPNEKLILYITKKDRWLEEYAKDITVREIKGKFMPPNVEFILGEKPICPTIDWKELGAEEVEINIEGLLNVDQNKRI